MSTGYKVRWRDPMASAAKTPRARPWLGIDFPEDVDRVQNEVLRRLNSK